MSLNRSKNQVKEKINPYEFIKLPEKREDNIGMRINIQG